MGPDSDSKLVVGWLVGDRDADAAAFMQDVAGQLAKQGQLTTDGNTAYLNAVEAAFGWNGIDYAVLQELCGKPTSDDTRYSPAVCIGIRKEWVMGQPVEVLVSTSYVGRSNLTLRMRCPRFARLTNAFSKKLGHPAAATALHYCVYNFRLTHQTLTRRAGGIHMTPAMAAGLTNRRWTVRDLVSLLDVQQAPT